jgi:hypothetical protein
MWLGSVPSGNKVTRGLRMTRIATVRVKKWGTAVDSKIKMWPSRPTGRANPSEQLPASSSGWEGAPVTVTHHAALAWPGRHNRCHTVTCKLLCCSNSVHLRWAITVPMPARCAKLLKLHEVNKTSVESAGNTGLVQRPDAVRRSIIRPIWDQQKRNGYD